MTEVKIDWKEIKSVSDFYNLFLPQVGAPEWHGDNLDALSDSLVTGSINEIETNYSIVNINSQYVEEGLKDFQSKVFEIFLDALLSKGYTIDNCEDHYRKVEIIFR